MQVSFIRTISLLLVDQCIRRGGYLASAVRKLELFQDSLRNSLVNRNDCHIHPPLLAPRNAPDYRHSCTFKKYCLAHNTARQETKIEVSPLVLRLLLRSACPFVICFHTTSKSQYSLPDSRTGSLRRRRPARLPSYSASPRANLYTPRISA